MISSQGVGVELTLLKFNFLYLMFFPSPSPTPIMYVNDILTCADPKKNSLKMGLSTVLICLLISDSKGVMIRTCPLFIFNCFFVKSAVLHPL